jgi:hypothetical protein
MRKNALMGLLAAIAALLGCKNSDQPPAPSLPPDPASQLPAATAAPSAQPKRRVELPELAARLGKIMADPAKHATNKDVGNETVTFYLKPFAGFVMPMFIGYRKNKKAWRFQLEYMRCDEIDQLGLEVTLLEREEAPIGGGYFNAWYEVDGGPLSGCWVKVHSKSVDEPHECVVMPGTPPFWETRMGDLPKSKKTR